jgi:hypothetical protein
MEFEHVTFDLPHGTFHALQGGDPDGQPTIVLHGFADRGNAEVPLHGGSNGRLGGDIHNPFHDYFYSSRLRPAVVLGVIEGM